MDVPTVEGVASGDAAISPLAETGPEAEFLGLFFHLTDAPMHQIELIQ